MKIPTKEALMKLILKYAKGYSHAGEFKGLLDRTNTANKLEAAISAIYSKLEQK